MDGERGMKEAWLSRTVSSDQGTFSHFYSGDRHWHTGELPWLDNLPNISCIQPGTHLCTYREDGSNGPCYELQDVPGRTVIQIHIGNFVGDESKGFKSDVRGCIVPGIARGKLRPKVKQADGAIKWLGRQEAVISSGKAIEEILEYFGKESFVLNIEDKIITA